MNYPFYISKRYLLAKKEAGFITIISIISIIGVSVGVAALIVVLSVFNGFNSLVTDILVGFDPHIRIQLDKKTTPDTRTKLESFLSQAPDVTGKSRFVNGKAMLISKKMTKVIFMRGLESHELGNVSGIKDKLVMGNAVVDQPKGNNLVLGFNLADRLGLGVDDTVFIVSSAGVKGSVTNMIPPPIYIFRIAGMYESSNKDYDGLYGFTSLRSGQQLFAMDSSINGYDIRLSSIDRSESFARTLRSRFGDQLSVQTWYDLHKDLYSVMVIERWTAFVILALIIAVASFNLLGSLTMTVIEKTRDIGILKAMGAKQVDIRKIFRFEGMVVGIVGSLIGLILGYGICSLQLHYQIFALDPTAYIIPALPIEMRMSDFIIVPVATLLLCYAATIYPSRRAAELSPADSIRWE